MGTMTIGGRDWKAVENSTLEHDFWTMGKIRAAGLDRIEILPGEEAKDLLLRIQRDAINFGVAYDLLGGFMVPAEMDPLDWTPELAKETGDFMKKLSDPKDKRFVQLQFAAMLTGFFTNGLALLLTSRKSSRVAENGEANIETEASSTSETGTSSSES